MRSMSGSDNLLRWLCWALIVFVVASAVLSIGISQNLLVSYPDLSGTTDFVARIAAIRAADQVALPVHLLSDLATIGVYVTVFVFGLALRPFVPRGTGRDTMTAVLMAGGIIGVIAALTLIGLSQAAAQGYCDCGYKTEELIGQAKALDMGFAVQDWLAIGGLVTAGAGIAMAGRLIEVGSGWRTLSYGIAIALILATALDLIGQGDLATIVVGLTAGILVTIWAILLARALPKLSSDPAASA